MGARLSEEARRVKCAEALAYRMLGYTYEKIGKVIEVSPDTALRYIKTAEKDSMLKLLAKHLKALQIKKGQLKCLEHII